MRVFGIVVVSVALLTAGTRAQAPRPAAPAAAVEQRETAVTAEQLKAAIDKLAAVDYATRTTAARTIRRVPVQTAVPALLDAIAGNPDGYVRFRALILLSGFNDPRTRDVMAQSLTAANDRLRAVAYAYFEHNPDTQILPRLLEALPTRRVGVRPSGADARAGGLWHRSQRFATR